MLKTIKVRQEVYNDLEMLRQKNETFGECIARLIKAYRSLTGIISQAPEEGR